jgi:hypothetical protein
MLSPQSNNGTSHRSWFPEYFVSPMTSAARVLEPLRAIVNDLDWRMAHSKTGTAATMFTTLSGSMPEGRTAIKRAKVGSSNMACANHPPSRANPRCHQGQRR